MSWSSIATLRSEVSPHSGRRELVVLEGSEYYKLMLLRQFKASQRKLWPVLETTPEKAMSDVRRYLDQTQRSFDLIMLDMPGTVSAPGVFRVLAELDYIFVPMKADKLVMESAVSFAKAVNEQLVQNPDYNLRGLPDVLDDDRPPGAEHLCMNNMKRHLTFSTSPGSRPKSRIAAGSTKRSSMQRAASDALRSFRRRKLLPRKRKSVLWPKRSFPFSRYNMAKQNRRPELDEQMLRDIVSSQSLNGSILSVAEQVAHGRHPHLPGKHLRWRLL